MSQSLPTPATNNNSTKATGPQAFPEKPECENLAEKLTDPIMFEHFRQAYQYELDRKDILLDRSIGSLALATSIVAAIAALCANVLLSRQSWDFLLLLSVVLAASIYLALLFSTYSYLRTLWGYDYEYVSDSLDNARYLSGYNASHNTDKSQPDLLRELLLPQYIHCANLNASLNDKRTKWITRAHRALTIAIILSVLNMPVCLLLYHSAKNL
jgi:hypothetical protein